MVYLALDRKKRLLKSFHFRSKGYLPTIQKKFFLCMYAGKIMKDLPAMTKPLAAPHKQV